MKMPIGGKNPPVLRPAPFGKGGHWGIFRRCFERGAAHFHLLCCTDWYVNYFAGDESGSESLLSLLTLQNLKAGFQHGAQEIVDVRLGGVELEDGDAALQAEVDLADTRHGLERFAQGLQIFDFEIADGEDGGFRAHRSYLGETLTNLTRLRNRRAPFRSTV
jgi:hypothetical protein